MKTIYKLSATGKWPEDGERDYYFSTIKAALKFAKLYYGATMDKVISSIDTDYIYYSGIADESARGYSLLTPYITINLISVYGSTDDIDRLAIIDAPTANEEE